MRESRERLRCYSELQLLLPFKRRPLISLRQTLVKEGASFDLPMMLGILGANGDLAESNNLIHVLCVGELSLDSHRLSDQRRVADCYAGARSLDSSLDTAGRERDGGGGDCRVSVYPVAITPAQ